MGTGALLGIDGSEYCLSCGGYCMGFFASRDEWCCLALVGHFLAFLFLLLERSCDFGGIGCDVLLFLEN